MSGHGYLYIGCHHVKRNIKGETMNTEFSYYIKRSKHSSKYYYLMEVATDEHFITERFISKPLTKEELLKLDTNIRLMVGSN